MLRVCSHPRPMCVGGSVQCGNHADGVLSKKKKQPDLLDHCGEGRRIVFGTLVAYDNKAKKATLVCVKDNSGAINLADTCHNASNRACREFLGDFEELCAALSETVRAPHALALEVWLCLTLKIHSRVLGRQRKSTTAFPSS